MHFLNDKTTIVFGMDYLHILSGCINKGFKPKSMDFVESLKANGRSALTIVFSGNSKHYSGEVIRQ